LHRTNGGADIKLVFSFVGAALAAIRSWVCEVLSDFIAAKTAPTNVF
jgi:hypothetical protein